MTTLEEIRRKYNDDSLHASIVPYVQPLLARIAELEKELALRPKEGCPKCPMYLP